MADLIEFLMARIAEDEEWARLSAGPLYSDAEPGTPGYSGRVLAECEAKRNLLNWHRQYDTDEAGEPHGREDQCPTWRLLASPYADHPDYRSEWKP
jgi:hypothetical protein